MQTNRIKVFFYIDSFRIGGMHRQVLYLVKHMNKEIFEPIMCTSNSDGGLLGEYEKVGCKLIDLGWKRTIDFAYEIKLVKILYSVKPDIVFISEAQNLFYFRIAKFFWFKKIIQIGSFRAMTFWKGHLNKFYHIIDTLFSKWLYLSSDCVVVNSYAMKNHYSSILKIKPNNPIKVIYNGSDFDFAVTKSSETIRNEINIAVDEFVIIMIARLDPWKDFVTLFEAAKIVIAVDKKAKFVIVGDGELRYSLEQMIEEMDLKNNIQLLYEKKDIFNYLNSTDISVLSTNGEGFSNSILESMAMGKPIIATNVGGNSELLGANEFGILVDPKSSIMLADAIIELIKDENKRKDLGKNARERIFELCNIEKLIHSYEELFIERLNNI